MQGQARAQACSRVLAVHSYTVCINPFLGRQEGSCRHSAGSQEQVRLSTYMIEYI